MNSKSYVRYQGRNLASGITRYQIVHFCLNMIVLESFLSVRES
jgi:hypothetical protein